MPRPAAFSGRPWLLLPLIVCGVYVLLQFAAGSSWTLYPDSYRYARSAEQHLGASRAEAHRTALAAYCASRADAAAATHRLDPLATGQPSTGSASACVARWADAPDITTGDSRYQAIFSSRPGYPLLAAPFIAAFGVLDGMRVLGVVLALAGSLLVLGVLRSAGLPPPAAVLGQIAFLVTPLGWWSLQALSEGLVTVCVLGVIWGGLLLMNKRPLPGVLLFAGSLAACTVTRYSTALVLAALIAATAFITWCVRRSRGALLLTAVAGAGAAVVALTMRLLDLPSTQVTLQDTFTRHFRSPKVPDPWSRLADLGLTYWRHWLAEQTAMPFFLVLTAAAIWALWRYGRGLTPLACAAFLTGVSQITAHPLAQEADRLGVLMWVPVVLGAPLIVLSLPDFSSGRMARTVRGPASTVEPSRADAADSR
ncbi:hypothetical protein [Streptomyces sp. NPDC050738]|uniref:hypothetical protein n=1 Tax=Streptomyces sp. NPDC050738 TaxID=3154744 RepID=UPI00342C2ECC